MGCFRHEEELLSVSKRNREEDCSLETEKEPFRIGVGEEKAGCFGDNDQGVG